MLVAHASRRTGMAVASVTSCRTEPQLQLSFSAACYLSVWCLAAAMAQWRSLVAPSILQLYAKLSPPTHLTPPP